MLRPPCEIVVPTFVRAVRISVARKLRHEEDLTQQQISRILGVSQPVVNQYLTKEQQNISQIGIRLSPIIQKTANKIVKSILSEFSEEKTLSILCLGCKHLRADGALCEAHKESVPAFQAFRYCSACRTTDLKDLEKLEHRRRLILELESLVDFLIGIPNIARLIPAVGTQLCLAPPVAKTNEDIVALPGGIVSVKGRALPVSEHAEFGASKTTAKVLLMKKDLMNEISAVISLRNTAEIQKILIEKGNRVMQTKGGDRDWSIVFTQREKEAQKANAIADEGEIGFEAVLYLFARNAAELKEAINDMVRHL